MGLCPRPCDKLGWANFSLETKGFFWSWLFDFVIKSPLIHSVIKLVYYILVLCIRSVVFGIISEYQSVLR